MSARKLTRSQIKPLAQRLAAAQDGLCPLCLKALDFTAKIGVCLDHDHMTGQIRGALCRACNSFEGKVFNATGRWCVGKMDYALTIPALERLIEYLRREQHPYIYPTHQTEEEKRVAVNAKARRARATRQARQVVRKSVVKKES